MAEQAKVKKYYTINNKNGKHIITVDTTVKPAKGDEEAVKLYVSMGYDLRMKSQARAEKMKENADGLNAEEIRKALKSDKDALKKFDDIIHGGGKNGTGVTNKEGKTGFFAAKKWYLKEYNK